MKQLKILGICCLLITSVATTFAFRPAGRCNVNGADCGVRGLSTQSIPNLPGFDFIQPNWFQATDLQNASESAEYWIDEVLPFPEYRNNSRYLVIPTMGMIVPIGEVTPGSDDYWKMRNGQQIDINKYLRDGVVRFPHSGYPGAPGNMFIFGHSNGLLSWDGEFNAVFAQIM